MAAASWSEAVLAAVRRHVAISGSAVFTRHALIDAELDRIIAATGSAGATPHQTLSRELQELRDRGALAFIEAGTYRLVESPQVRQQTGSKGVFLIRGDSIYGDEPDRFYRFPQMYLSRALTMVGQWIVYMEPNSAGRRGYHAVARVERIVSDPTTPKMHLAIIEQNSYLELGRDVPWRVNGQLVERGLVNADGRVNNGRAVWAVRPLANSDFNRIVGLGLVEMDEMLPRAVDAQPSLALVQEEQAGFEGPMDREVMLVNRKVRDRQFRNTVLNAYEGRCALTGMKLVNGGGRLETEAAHIMSVEAGGPDKVNNGLALSGTVHWMFDRGLISLSDEGAILLSGKINDINGVKKMIHADGQARWPNAAMSRPHPHYLGWHRKECFHG